MTRQMRSGLALALAALAVAATGCTGGSSGPTAGPTTAGPATTTTGAPSPTATPVPLPTGSDRHLPLPADIDPADFVATVDNPYYPLVPGTRYRFESKSEVVVLDVTKQTKLVHGVSTVVVRDTVTAGGKLVEDTYDWFAQDRDGNVWYFGEDTKEYENGKVKSTKGSWEAGVRGARAGLIMPARPRVGEWYRQEYFKGEAEDMAEVVGLDAHASVKYGAYDHVVKTRDFTPLEPSNVEFKYYARGVGFVLTESKGGERLQLVAVTRF